MVRDAVSNPGSVRSLTCRAVSFGFSSCRKREVSGRCLSRLRLLNL